MLIFEYIPLPALIALEIALVNVAVEVAKKVVRVKRPERAVMACSTALSVAAAICAAVLQGWQSWWQLVIAALVGVIAGVLVAYAAMFGYDDLYKQILTMLGALLPHKEGE